MQTAAMKKYREEHPMCEHHAFFFHRLNVPAEELHHIEGRSVDDESNFIMLCRDCHRNAEAEVRLYQAAHLYYKDKTNHAPDSTIFLPWQIVPASRPRFTRRGKKHAYTEANYKKFKEDLTEAMATGKMNQFDKDCSIRITYTAPDWNGLDWDNCGKGVTDSVCSCDNRITDARVKKIVTKENPFIKLEYWR